MSEYDLRSAFPLNGKEYTARGGRWLCELEEVSDLRPEADRLSWYVVFRSSPEKPGRPTLLRKLEIVTAGQVLTKGWRPDMERRILDWLSEGGDDDRVEWLDRFEAE
ncbi:MAG: hypothetical protein M3Y72_10860 [Acidobacteriota bacterium]|nr:hypothetical protein [Acidobacteriota bacterium]